MGYEGVDPKKPRIQLKITPSSEGKETAHPSQGSSDSISGKSRKEQVKTIVKAKGRLTAEDIPTQDKKKKTAEDPPPRAQSPIDLSVQANAGTEVPEDCPLWIEASAEVSEGKPLFISRTEWIEATKPLKHLVRVFYVRTIIYKTPYPVRSRLTTLLQVAQATERATEKLGQELERTKSELRSRQDQAQKAAEEAQAKLTILEEEVGKLRKTSQGDLAKAVVRKVLGSKSFTGFVSQLGQLSSKEAQSDLLGELAEENGLPLRKKDYGWNPHAKKVTKKTYAQLVLQKPPVFPILEHLSGLTDLVSVEGIDHWDEDDDLTLAEDLMLEIPANYEDLDPSTPDAEAGKTEEEVPENER